MRARAAAAAQGGEPADARAAQQGDPVAFVRLVRRHECALHAFLKQFSKDATVLQDLHQETILQALRSLPTYRHRAPFFLWLKRIAARVGYRHWSNKAREARAGEAYLEFWKLRSYPSMPLQERENVERARTILERLDPRDRALLEMRYLEGCKASEIARRIGRNAPAVRVRLHRALRNLRSRQRSEE